MTRLLSVYFENKKNFNVQGKEHTTTEINEKEAITLKGNGIRVYMVGMRGTRDRKGMGCVISIILKNNVIELCT